MRLRIAAGRGGGQKRAFRRGTGRFFTLEEKHRTRLLTYAVPWLHPRPFCRGLNESLLCGDLLVLQIALPIIPNRCAPGLRTVSCRRGRRRRRKRLPEVSGTGGCST